MLKWIPLTCFIALLAALSDASEERGGVESAHAPGARNGASDRGEPARGQAPTLLEHARRIASEYGIEDTFQSVTTAASSLFDRLVDYVRAEDHRRRDAFHVMKAPQRRVDATPQAPAPAPPKKTVSKRRFGVLVPGPTSEDLPTLRVDRRSFLSDALGQELHRKLGQLIPVRVELEAGFATDVAIPLDQWTWNTVSAHLPNEIQHVYTRRSHPSHYGGKFIEGHTFLFADQSKRELPSRLETSHTTSTLDTDSFLNLVLSEENQAQDGRDLAYLSATLDQLPGIKAAVGDVCRFALDRRSLAGTRTLRKAGDANKPCPTRLTKALAGANVWISAANVTAHAHYDVFHNVFIQVLGRKLVRLAPPAAHQCLRLHSHLGPHARQSQLHHHEMERDCQPFFRTSVVGPGDILFVPSGWIHHITALEPSVSVNVWSASNHSSALATLLDNPLPFLDSTWPEDAQQVAIQVFLVRLRERLEKAFAVDGKFFVHMLETVFGTAEDYIDEQLAYANRSRKDDRDSAGKRGKDSEGTSPKMRDTPQNDGGNVSDEEDDGEEEEEEHDGAHQSAENHMSLEELKDLREKISEPFACKRAARGKTAKRLHELIDAHIHHHSDVIRRIENSSERELVAAVYFQKVARALAGGEARAYAFLRDCVGGRVM